MLLYTDDQLNFHIPQDAVVCFVPSGKVSPLPDPVIFIFPLTSKLSAGVVVHIPTFPFI